MTDQGAADRLTGLWRLRLKLAAAAARTWLSVRGAALLAAFDKRDHLLLAGLALLGYGLAQVWPPLAFIVPGAIVTAVAILGVR